MEASGVITGTCMSMCPDSEVQMREREGLLHPFEADLSESERHQSNWPTLMKGKSPVKSPSKHVLKADRRRMVKEYSRSAAGRNDLDPSAVRPSPVLTQTMSYLLTDVAILQGPSWADIYDFVFDRIRAVRQDMVVQGIMGRDAIVILEQAVRFHVYASYRLRSCDISIFDPVINRQHFLECLKRLLYLYQVTEGQHQNQAEFLSIYLLDSLGNEDVLCYCLPWRNDPLVQTSFSASLAVLTGNYHRTLRLLHRIVSLPCLCVVSYKLMVLRIDYLKILSHGYNSKNCQFPLQRLCDLLHLPTPDLVSDLCASCLTTDWFSSPETVDYISLKKSNFSYPSDIKACPSIDRLEAMEPSTSLCDFFLYGRVGGGNSSESVNNGNCGSNYSSGGRGVGRGRNGSCGRGVGRGRNGGGVDGDNGSGGGRGRNGSGGRGVGRGRNGSGGRGVGRGRNGGGDNGSGGRGVGRSRNGGVDGDNGSGGSRGVGRSRNGGGVDGGRGVGRNGGVSEDCC